MIQSETPSLVDRGSGKAIGVTLWEDEQAMTQSRERADQLRQQAADTVSAEIESVNEYELAVWDVKQARSFWLVVKGATAL